MHFYTLARVLKLGWTNYWRNRGLSISATLILSLTLVIVLVFLLINGVVGAATHKIHDKIDVVLTFDDQISDDQIHALQKLLVARPEVKDVTYVSKDDAIARFYSLPGISEKTKNLVTRDNNPLPRSLEIRASAPDQLAGINQLVSAAPWKDIIRKNSYLSNRDTIDKLNRFERAVTTAGIGLSIVFMLISLIVVINTIRLAIFARREEIEIMRLVGANNIFIRIPFVVEAVLYGLVATALALSAAWLAISRIAEALKPYLGEIDFDLPAVFIAHLPLILAVELALALGLAVFASLVSIQRYLNR